MPFAAEDDAAPLLTNGLITQRTAIS